MKPVLTAAAMFAAEKEFFACGGSPRDAMYRAGSAVAEHCRSFKRILVFCHCGNNGGDGFVAAYLLAAMGKEVDILLSGDPARLSPHATFYKSRIEDLIRTAPQGEYDCVIDALLGIGFHAPLSQELKVKALQINAYRGQAHIVAIDVPTGLDATTGEADGAVTADETVTFACLKYGHLIGCGPAFTGKVTVCDIGIPVRSDLMFDEKEDIALPPLSPCAHKGTRGFAGIVAAGKGMEGAGLLCATAALHTCCGKVALSVPENCLSFFDRRTPELMLDTAPLSSFIKNKDILVVGPGLGRDECARNRVLTVLHGAACPCVVDADGLFALTEEDLQRVSIPLVLTPHMGEAARLFGVPMQELSRDPAACAAAFARKTHTVVLLKSHYNIITDGTKTVITHFGTPGMATAGSGDVLAGITAGAVLLCKNTFDGALLASFLHGTAGCCAAKVKTDYAMVASDLIDFLPRAFSVAKK